MSFSARRIVPVCVVAALACATGSYAIAQTPAPAAVVETEPSPTVASQAATPLDGMAVASEQPPTPPTTIETVIPAEPETVAQPENAPASVQAPDAPVDPAVSGTLDPAPSKAEAPPEMPTALPVVAPLVVDVAAALARVADQRKLEKRDLDGIVAAYGAREGRPIWMTAKGATEQAVKLAYELAKAEDWGLSAVELDTSGIAPVNTEAPDLTPDALADADVRLSLAALMYAQQARGRVQPKDLTSYLDRELAAFEPQTVLEQIAGSADPDAYLRKLHPQHPQFELLRQRYLAIRDEPAPAKGPSEAERILANMEQWRWMPADLGALHIWVNIPEQMFSVMRDGQSIHRERVIIGKTNTQTPIFSDRMRFLVFHPFWGVPNSIKTNDILPGLQRGSPVLEKRNLRLQLNGKDVDPSRFDWRKTDIRRFHVYQRPSPGNALGVVKFMFPNKHDVYLHDTPSKSLFKQSSRVISAGCVRVQNPLRFAELLLAEDQGLSAESVRALARKGAPENNQVNLRRPVPVHLTYFTMWAGPDGKITSYRDFYGHEERIRLALAGKMHLVKPVPEPTVPVGPVGRLVEVSASSSEGRRSGRTRSSGGYSSYNGPSFSNAPRPDWARRVFSGNGSYNGGN